MSFEDSTKTFEGFGGDPTVCKETIHIFSVASGCLGVEMVGGTQMQMKLKAEDFRNIIWNEANTTRNTQV